MDFKNLNFTDFVRYSLTGLNFILFVTLLPAIYFAPGMTKDLVSETSILTILLFSIAVGYLMDMLKIYQFAPNFNKNKTAFHKQISETLDVPIEQADSYLSITSSMWDENSTYHFERRRAEWVLILHTGAALFISFFVWIALVVSNYFENGFSRNLYLPLLIAVVSLLLAVRLYRVGTREIRKDDRKILLIMGANKKKIKEAWKLAEKTDRAH
ncbi:MAG TPA: hypothetical protein VHP14_16345 [Anaerolineales bacterium]|nr:hypothetical protein [Anaerolineales bacterium]